MYMGRRDLLAFFFVTEQMILISLKIYASLQAFEDVMNGFESFCLTLFLFECSCGRFWTVLLWLVIFGSLKFGSVF